MIPRKARAVVSTLATVALLGASTTSADDLYKRFFCQAKHWRHIMPDGKGGVDAEMWHRCDLEIRINLSSYVLTVQLIAYTITPGEHGEPEENRAMPVVMYEHDYTEKPTSAPGGDIVQVEYNKCVTGHWLVQWEQRYKIKDACRDKSSRGHAGPWMVTCPRRK